MLLCDGAQRVKNLPRVVTQPHLDRASNSRPSRDSAATLVHAFVTSLIDYGNALLANAPKIWTEKLQRVLNAAARVITGTRKFDSGLSHILRHDLHWLDVPQRVIFKLLVTYYLLLLLIQCFDAVGWAAGKASGL